MRKNSFENEIWKPVKIDVDCINKTRYEVSNFGRIRSFNKISNGRILKGSLTEGYRIIRLRLHSPRSEETLGEIDKMEEELARFYAKRRILEEEGAPPLTISRVNHSLKKRDEELRAFKRKDLKKRTIHHHFLFHRLVAEYFLPKPKPEETIVAHLDYEKLNNRADNLKWMNFEEHQEHIKKSPYVIAEKKQRKYTHKLRFKDKGWKLDSTQVMHIKMLLRRGWTLKRIARKFDVSDMQIHRIKTGENWSHVKIPE